MLVDGRIQIRTNKLQIWIQEAQNHTEPTDTDPVLDLITVAKVRKQTWTGQYFRKTQI
jgi:hypothetical protein